MLENRYPLGFLPTPLHLLKNMSRIFPDYNKADYGVLTENERTAIRFLAEKEGILLDPVYTGRAFYGLLDMLKNKKIKPGSNVLFWHTGGLPALFSYAGGLK